ncbi:MAG: UDP-N-acetylmuramate dehydrogenase [bacterium]
MNKNNYTGLLNGLRDSNVEFLENESMSAYSSIKIGGLADLIIFPKNEIELVSVISLLKVNSYSYYIIGRGTNILFKDTRICLPVISFKKFNAGISENKKNESETVIEVGAGMSLSKILNYAIKNSISGCEFFYGIPGTLGGAVRMNAGSKESVIGNITLAIEIVTDEGIKYIIEKHDLKFSYRNLDINGIKDNYFITKAYLNLYIASDSKIKENIEVFKKRKSSQPLGEFSLGCIFKNPSDVAAGKVIEEIGFKGFSKGGAFVSEKHANFIVNKGGAKSDDIMFLIKNIQEKALLHKGIKLNTEIKII